MNKRIKLLSITTSLLTLSTPMLMMACETAQVEHIKVGITKNDVFLVTDTTTVEDRGFNEQGYEALKTITEYTDFIKLRDERVLAQDSHETDDLVDKGYRVADKNGAKLIIAPGFYHISAINKYNDTTKVKSNFILADGHIKQRNVASIKFDVKYPAFQAGYLACTYLETRLDPNPKIAMWGGDEIDSVTDFLTGFIYGIYHYNETRADGTPKVELVKTNLEINSNDVIRTNTGFDSIEKGNQHGKNTAEKSIEQGADIIFPVAGAQTSDVIKAIKDPQWNRTKSVRIVGVDTNQADKFALDKNLFITSVEKNVQKGFEEVYKVITKDDDADTESYNGLGELTLGNLTNGLVKISNNTALGYGWTQDDASSTPITNIDTTFANISSWTVANIDSFVVPEESNHTKLSQKTWEMAKALANNWTNTK